ncbi:MAG: universal stress protein [Deltaproteobacteria bacterium]|nr:MAG: universal stress protein [Deltaproteobacteria bacterium]
MSKALLHVFRNAPYGRETLLFSAYTCRRLQLKLKVYIPKDPSFLLYFDHKAVQIDLDGSYLRKYDQARETVETLLGLGPKLEVEFIEPTGYTGTGLPDLDSHVAIMSCPRSMSEPTSRIGLGLLGPRVRSLITHARFPVLIPPGVYKPWTRLTVLYGGSELASRAVRLGRGMADACNLSLQVISFGNRNELRNAAEKQGLTAILEQADWLVLDGRPNPVDLDAVPHDALVLLGAYGQGPIRNLFGSTMEMVQAELPNPLLVLGPNVHPLPDFS